MPIQKKPSDELFSTAEIKTALNNTVIAALRPATLGAEIPRNRMQRLSAYVREFVRAMTGHVEEGLLRPEEAVLIFTAAGLLVQSQIREVQQSAIGTDPSVSAIAADVLSVFFGPEGSKMTKKGGKVNGKG